MYINSGDRDLDKEREGRKRTLEISIVCCDLMYAVNAFSVALDFFFFNNHLSPTYIHTFTLPTHCAN